MITDVQERVDNLIHKVEGFLKDLHREKELLGQDILLEERPFKVDDYEHEDSENWEDFDDSIGTMSREGTSIDDLTKLFGRFLVHFKDELKGNDSKVRVLREGKDFVLKFRDEYTLRMMFEEFSKRRLVDEDEEDDDFEGMSITYKETDSGEENE